MFMQLLYWAALAVAGLSFLIAAASLNEFLEAYKERHRGAGSVLTITLVGAVAFLLFGLLMLAVGLKGLGFWA